MRRSVVCVLLALGLGIAGCYDPNPPGGAYLCASGDHACPSGQHCTCGLCVTEDSQAACGFSIDDQAAAKSKLLVSEHQSFPITIHALQKSGAPAGGFSGTVQLSSSWGDVKPPTATLVGGSATVMVQLNRETLSPAVATLSASFAGNSGKSGGINVQAPSFSVSSMEIAPPFGWATNVVAEPSVTKIGNQYTMYFVGDGGQGVARKTGIGLATSTDGQTFTPAAGLAFDEKPGDFIFSPSVYQTSSGSLMAYALADSIDLAASSDGTSFSPLTGPMLGLSPSQCSYCKGASRGQVTFPQVVPDVLAPVPDGGTAPWLMFFSAVATDANNNSSVSIGRASSPDGKTWTPEPAPILSGDLTGEVVLLSPRVLVDGTVYKMWYSFAKKIAVQLYNPLDPFSALCASGSEVDVGYATSSDGFFWTKSIHNPVLKIAAGSTDYAYLVSSVLPTDGVDAANGITLFYSPFRLVTSATGSICVPNGIDRATRP